MGGSVRCQVTFEPGAPFVGTQLHFHGRGRTLARHPPSTCSGVIRLIISCAMRIISGLNIPAGARQCGRSSAAG